MLVRRISDHYRDFFAAAERAELFFQSILTIASDRIASDIKDRRHDDNNRMRIRSDNLRHRFRLIPHIIFSTAADRFLPAGRECDA